MKNSNVKIIKKILIILSIIAFFALTIFLCIDLIEPIKEAIDTNSLLPLEEKFESYGLWKYFIIGLSQAILLVTAIIPTEIIQIIAGFCCGAKLGFLCCMAGIFLGNLIIFIIFRLLGKNSTQILDEKEKEKLQVVSSNGKNKSTLFILSLYFVPGIPYGVASISAANTKISFFRYIILTTLGAVPATVLCTIFGHFAIEEAYLPFTILLSLCCILIVFALKFKDKILIHLSNRSIRATAIWLLFAFINAGFSMYFAFINDIKKMFFNIMIFFLYIILYLLLNKPFSKLFENSRKKYNMQYFQGPIKKANPILYGVLRFFLKIYFFTKYKVEVDKKNMPKFEKPTILLFNHPAKLDFLWSFIPVYPNKVNAVVAYYYFCNYHLGRLIKSLGAFPKYLYQPDVSSMKNIVRVMKNNGILGIAPEGRLSPHGCMEKVIPSTAKMIKKFGIQVIITKIHGSYFSTPKWALTSRKGKVHIEYKEIFSKDQIKNLSVNEIYEILKKECDYDEFAWQEKNNIYYKGKRFAEGLEHLLYICPVCKHEYTFSSKNNTLTCTHCNTKVTLDNYYQFHSDNELVPKNIRDWYNWQKQIERKNIEDPNYQFTSHVTLKHPDSNGKGFAVVGEGYTTINSDGIVYKGSINNEEKEILFKIENLPAVLFGIREDFEIYHHNTLYYFVPDNIRECVKWSVVSEQMYQKYLEENNIEELEKSEWIKIKC